MTVEEDYRARYQSGDIPWDVGRADFNLIDVVTQKPIPSCKALDIGCGTGDNSIWLARNGFKVTGTDGKFEIAGLDAGTYELEAWHERLGTLTANVTVASGATETVDFTFKR